MTSLMKKIGGVLGGAGSLHANPGRDWLLLLCGAIALLAVSVGWNAWFLNRVVDEGIEAGAVGSQTLDAYKASGVNEVFGARATTSAAYRETYVFIDPSR